MIKRLLIFTLFFFFSIIMVSKAQRANIDSLIFINNYLLDIKSTVTATKLSGKKKISTLDNLIRLGSKNQAIFEKHLSGVVGKDESKYLISKYRFVVQSAIVYKTDFKQNGFKENKSALNEKLYLNKEVPPLVDRIYHHAAKAKEINNKIN